MGVAALTERVLGVAQANAAFDEATLRYTLAREHTRGMLVYGKECRVSGKWMEVRRRCTHQVVAVQILDGVSGKRHILKLDKAHGSIDLLPERHSLVSCTSREQGTEGLFEKVGRMGRRGDGREVANVERVDLPNVSEGKGMRGAAWDEGPGVIGVVGWVLTGGF